MWTLGYLGFPGGACGKEPACQCMLDPWVRKDPLEGGMAIHSTILAPWVEDPGSP